MTTTAPRRLTREQAKAETRRRLLEAARSVFLREGYHGATLDSIAEEAGVTKGAVYSAFASKADFFLALYEERQRERREDLQRQLRPPVKGDAREIGPRRWAESLSRDRDWLLLLLEFWTHAARDPGLRRRFARLHAEVRRTYAEAMRSALPGTRHTSDAEVQKAARASMALGNGYALEAALDPGGDLAAEYRAMQAALDVGLGNYFASLAPPRPEEAAP